MFSLREYQKEKTEECIAILNNSKLCYLSAEVRTGKTHIALAVADKMNFNTVLFVTKKKAISSIESDFKIAGYSYNLTVINYESLHKLDLKCNYDLLITDEAHSFGAFPKPSKRAKDVKKLKFKYQLYLSGTMSPESYSQIFHQMWVNKNNPFKEYINFYKWSKDYVTVTQKRIGAFMANDYSNANYDKIINKIKHIVVTLTQKEASFNTTINEKVLTVKMQEKTYRLCERLKRDLVIEGTSGVILADTGVKLMQKLHQLYSGTVKLECGKSVTIDNSKAIYVQNYFKGNKIAIFYKFKQELEVLKETFKNDLTTDIEEFNNTNKSIALQIVSGREGINLSKADYLVFYNIDFSATSYWQGRDRLTTIDRKENTVYWIFSDGGIESKVYRSVMNKKNYTLSIFKNGK